MRILWLKTELLHPVDTGGRIRSFNILRELKRRHHITYLAFCDEDGGSAVDLARERSGEYCHELITVPHRIHPKFTARFFGDLAQNLFSPVPLFVERFESDAMKQAIGQQLESGCYDLMVCDFLMPSINIPDTVSHVPSLLFQHNVEAMIRRRQFEVETNPVKRAVFRSQWRKSEHFEGLSCRRFDQVVAVSREDAETLARDYDVDSVTDIPTGVDIDYFRSGRRERIKPNTIVFTGSMDWLPNDDAIQFFVESIMPRIRQSIPDATLTVVGRNPRPKLVQLGERDPSISITGRVDDIRPYVEQAAAYVVPLRIGGGTRLKIYEAMAMEKAVVSTSIGAEGLHVTDGKHLILADDPQSFADAVIRVLKNPSFANLIASNAAQMVREQFGWDKIAAAFSDACENTVTRFHSPRQTSRSPVKCA
jgi:polysaccharide biosynthesis protein PslH